MKKIVAYRWFEPVNRFSNDGKFLGRQIVKNDTVDMIEFFFNTIQAEKRPKGTKNYRMVRKFVKATEKAKKKMDEYEKEHSEEILKTRNEFQQKINKLAEEGTPVSDSDIREFERDQRIESVFYLDDDIYEFIMKEAIEQQLDAAIGFSDLTSDAIDAIIDAKDYDPNEDV